MPVATLLGAPPAALAPWLGPPLRADRFHYAGVHVGDDGEWAFQRAHRLGWLDPARPLTGPVHVHFDLDVLDPAAFPHVAYPEGRLAPAAALVMVRALAASATLVGLTITEFAPANDSAAAEGGQFLRQLCDAAFGTA
jgi:arginase